MAFYRIALSTRHFAASTATHYYIIIVLAAHALAPLALSAARCEQCRFVPEMIA